MQWRKTGSQHNYASPEYRRNREVAMRRDKGLCQYCLLIEGRITAGTECDHIVSIANGGTDDADNLQMLCDEHHWQKTAFEKQKGQQGWPDVVDWDTGWSSNPQERILAARNRS